MTERIVAVTGSASGIGAAVASRLRADGARVIGVDLHDAEVEADLAGAEGRDRVVAAVADAAGGRLHGLVACAGLGPHVRPAGTIAAVNYFSTVHVVDGLLPALAAAAAEGAAAVVISSNSAGITPRDDALLGALEAGDEQAALARADEIDGAVVYGTTKLAVARGVRRRAEEWGAGGVRLNAVAPGPVDTPLLAASLADPTYGPLVDALPIPLGRRAAPDEIAAVVAFLLGPEAGYVHGSVLFADGGSDALLRPDAV
ncbi:MAG TPA: SDR family oxidoreductase [Acidimicrobiales bacterium]|nr:SDR family oxidoreductase [Acidimicrobiales bacterium]